MGLLLLPFRINFSTECTSWSCYCPVWQEFFLASSYYFWVVPCVKLEKCFPFSCWTGKDFGSTLTHGKIPPLELLSFLYSHSHKLSLIPLPHPRVSVPSILCCQPGCAPKHFPTSSSHSLSTLPTLRLLGWYVFQQLIFHIWKTSATKAKGNQIQYDLSTA